jgi:hypothetical protein
MRIVAGHGDQVTAFNFRQNFHFRPPGSNSGILSFFVPIFYDRWIMDTSINS